MSDFNFFSPYLLEKRNRRQKKLFIIAVSALLLIALLAFTYLNAMQITKYKEEINKVESYMNSAKTTEMLGKYQNTTRKLELTKEYFDKASEAAAFVKNSNKVNTALLDKLSSVMPENTTLINITVNYNIIELQYNANSLTSIAEIQHNLKNLNIFDYVSVNTVTNEASYKAVVSCSLKDVDTSEAQTDK